jgi:hypothetical protein
LRFLPPCHDTSLPYQQLLLLLLQVGKAKEKAAEADKKKRKAADKFAAFVRSAEGLYVSTTWEEFEDAFKSEEEFVAVSVM